MKKITLALLFCSFSLSAQNSGANCEILLKINRLLQNEHYSPKPVNDSLSAYVFDELLNDLDPARNIFLKSQADSLSSKYRLQLDDLILKDDCSFLDDIKSEYKKSLLRNKVILEKLNAQTIDFKIKDTIRFKEKSFNFYLQANEAEKAWNKKIRFEIFNDIAGKSKNLDSLKLNFNLMSQESKKDVIENELCKINSSLSNDKFFEDNFYNIFCIYFDPHTNYFNNDTKSSFVSTLSKEKLSLGLEVSLNEKNEINIIEIDPNGPAFKTGKIKKGDLILAISNQKETLEVSCSSLEAISTMMSSELNTILTLTLKRNSGKSFKVTIEKQVLKDEENTVYSFIVEKDVKVGYIKIPSFYSDFDGENSKGCAQDVAKETIKLMQDDIKGLILDLTDNGGGSMEEAVKLAGLFIDRGPISIVADNKKQLSIINDPYKGVIYKGPIVIIINGNSASASEFFADIMQDYNRSVLIGSTSLGKATMQAILPLEKNDDQHFVKLTVSKFYRITGKSHQAIGVIPDVQIPTVYQDVFQKESDFPTALKNDTLKSRIRFNPYVSNELIESLAQKSKKRVAQDPYFNSIIALNKNIDAVINKSKLEIPMTLDAVFENQTNIMALSEEINNFSANDLNLNVSNSEYNKSLLILYPALLGYNKIQLDNLKSNHYLNEAISIINDYKALRRNN
ncbi:S41 family peptidase [Flavobacterium aquicola]|uniref:Carboxyl-terminal processing protease n=1 Tax=Flavobacterium aquicola TaxID=1682742 RepID=A0A3E0END6_9FLAO|nr:S41 family peptidase [Flavobacterium aquicola]REG99681.1 carboxyl-terminal processing protease [Flavobacterium aquicola]